VNFRLGNRDDFDLMKRQGFQEHIDSSNVLERLPALAKHATKYRLLSDLIDLSVTSKNILVISFFPRRDGVLSLGFM